MICGYGISGQINATGVLILYVLSQLQEVCCELEVFGLLPRSPAAGHINGALCHLLALSNMHFPTCAPSGHRQSPNHHEMHFAPRR